MKHEIESFDVEPPTHMDILVGMIRKTSHEEAFGWLSSTTVRMPIVTACTIDAMAQYSGQSRNKIMVKALEAALDQVWEQLPEKEREELEEVRSKLLTERIASFEKGEKQESGEV